MSDFAPVALRAAAAAREARALVTAILPAVVFGMTREGPPPEADFSDALAFLSKDSEYSQIQENVIDVFNAIGLRDDPAVSDLPQVMAAALTSTFIVHYAMLLGEDPYDVWQKYVAEMSRIECQLEN